MLSPRAIATQGVGFGARLTAVVGLWPVSVPDPQPQPGVGPGAYSLGRAVRRQSNRRDTDDDLLMLLL